jgi:bifunctional non-homologous end joining protein LigD
MPVRWEELHRAMKAADSTKLYFEPEDALRRLEKMGDPFAPVLDLKQSLPEDFVAQVNARSGRRSGALNEYGRKRDFARTPEPSPTVPRRSNQGGRRRFVVQKHAASHLHYDFRLEMGGALKSWAVPRGVPYAPGEERLAAATEDHPLEYLSIEGVIPQGQYGGGTVMVWDIGTYEIVDGNYYRGNLNLFLEGKKLKGEWTLTRREGKNWTLAKSGSAMKSLPAKGENTSALTGRTMEEIAEARDATWQSNRIPAELANLPPMEAKFIEPMRAKAVPKLPEGGNWEFKIKLDGYRSPVVKRAGEVLLMSRNANRLNDRFPIDRKRIRSDGE